MTVALSTHETGSPQAVKIAPPADKTEETKQAGENTLSKEIFSEMDLSGKTITADALSGNQPMASAITAGGGDYILQIKGNYPHAHDYAQQVHQQTEPFFALKSTAIAISMDA